MDMARGCESGLEARRALRLPRRLTSGRAPKCARLLLARQRAAYKSSDDNKPQAAGSPAGMATGPLLDHCSDHLYTDTHSPTLVHLVPKGEAAPAAVDAVALEPAD